MADLPEKSLRLSSADRITRKPSQSDNQPTETTLTIGPKLSDSKRFKTSPNLEELGEETLTNGLHLITDIKKLNY